MFLPVPYRGTSYAWCAVHNGYLDEIETFGGRFSLRTSKERQSVLVSKILGHYLRSGFERSGFGP